MMKRVKGHAVRLLSVCDRVIVRVVRAKIQRFRERASGSSEAVMKLRVLAPPSGRPRDAIVTLSVPSNGGCTSSTTSALLPSIRSRPPSTSSGREYDLCSLHPRMRSHRRLASSNPPLAPKPPHDDAPWHRQLLWRRRLHRCWYNPSTAR